MVRVVSLLDLGPRLVASSNPAGCKFIFTPFMLTQNRLGRMAGLVPEPAVRPQFVRFILSNLRVRSSALKKPAEA
jgi:hypothetical protein